MDNSIKKVIIRPEGGICSQIAFCGLIHHLATLGYSVKIDLSWYKEWGKDINGIFARNWDIDKAFPNFKYELATETEIKNYKEKYNVNSNWEQLQPQMYICGIPKRHKILLKYRLFFKNLFNPIDVSSIELEFQEIQKQKSCAIHVRRGDLATTHNKMYGEPVEPEYFINTVNQVNTQNPGIKFFFFSDEPNYINEKIIPFLPDNVRYKVVDKNGSDKGYLDLYLISKCDIIIASNGSMGTFALFLSSGKSKLIMKQNPFLNY